ncbi:DDE-type integrase/transposase/recombinase [Burkholderia thailandensis]|uniref:Bacterial regulatory, Fis family protein n=1 Tax=Burkholderia thailandensis TaxID=57975 RepID=A0AAW9CSA2_BURTH|nr:DDE-type integrase/transposase/recombinase [Burkholderia thailandensis]AHI66879.1 bacterial regulatory, Fis family protein [Burkholderia thailandensis H0587]AIP66429.1 integrase [Burkholderia thailandensis]AJY31719.1 bacterial regulatory, Fis family protein [Burkholderia thailandensis 34]AOI55919.1 integrase [Burkholderia thailandensis]AOJ54880.1 integrase [Burkholderia thailandensis]
MNAVLTERIVAVAQAARAAGHGNKEAIYEAACRELGISRATLMRRLKAVALMPPRKRRADAGRSALTRAEAMTISALLIESTRKNGKRLYSIPDAVETLRANGMIRAESLDETTGELHPLSDSAIQRALRMYGVHPDQLLAPAPVTELASRHPNHVWQIDASLCVLYYLKPSADSRANGLRVMDHSEFYKNKPRNIARIAADRVWSYEITDHASGWIYVEYVLGAESGENLCATLINAMQERGGADLMHGVPRILMLDAGAANTAAMTRNLCRALGIELAVHKVGNARATGQVENARNIIERKFEPGLKFQPVNSLDELNALAKRWRMHFNATATHARHGATRSDAWLRITARQLTKAPALDVCRELAVAAPESRKVTPKLRVSFRGVEYDVSSVPGVMVGEKLMVTRNPWRDDAAQIVLTGDDGRETYLVVPEVARDALGFAIDAAVIGESFRRHADTRAQQAIGEIERIVSSAHAHVGTNTARGVKALPFGGRLDPYKHIDDGALPTYLPRRGTEHELAAPRVAHAPLSLVDAALRIKPRVEAAGATWSAERFRWLQQRYPDGVPHERLDAIVAELAGPQAEPRQPLHVVRAAGGR